MCHSCGTEWDTEFEAQDCCPNFVSEEERWACSECEVVYYSKKRAKGCCANQTLKTTHNPKINNRRIK